MRAKIVVLLYFVNIFFRSRRQTGYGPALRRRRERSHCRFESCRDRHQQVVLSRAKYAMNANRTYDWTTIQKYYEDTGCSLRNLTEHFGCAALTIQRARDAGLFSPREKNELRRIKKATRVANHRCHCGNMLSARSAKFCSNTCYAEAHRKQYISDWKLGLRTGADANGDLKRFIKFHLLELANFTCCQCGCNDRNPHSNASIIQIDHIDGDPSNNSYGNLRALCPNCHARTATFGGLNRGNGKFSKRLYYARQQAKLKKVT
jgi:hypothetical protein